MPAPGPGRCGDVFHLGRRPWPSKPDHLVHQRLFLRAGDPRVEDAWEAELQHAGEMAEGVEFDAARRERGLFALATPEDSRAWRVAISSWRSLTRARARSKRSFASSDGVAVCLTEARAGHATAICSDDLCLLATRLRLGPAERSNALPVRIK
jgi:hypothetical protein